MSNLDIIMIRIVEITTSTNDFPLNLIEYVRLVKHYCVCVLFCFNFHLCREKRNLFNWNVLLHTNCSLHFSSAWTYLRVSLGNCLVFLARPKLTSDRKRKRKPSLAKSKEITRGVHCLIRISWIEYRSTRVTLCEYCSIRVTLFEYRSIRVTLFVYRSIIVTLFEYCSIRVTLFEYRSIRVTLFEYLCYKWYVFLFERILLHFQRP